MKRSIVGRLVAKDLHAYRWLMAGALLAGIASLAASSFDDAEHGTTGVGVGFLLFMTTLIAFGVLLAMVGILKERQDRSQLFVLSLPVSPAQYVVAKVTAALVAYLVPWGTLTVGVVAFTTLSGRPSGEIPFFVAMMTFFLAIFCLLLAVVVVTLSEVWSIAAILLTNLSVPIFLSRVSALPGVAGHGDDPMATWSPALRAVLAAEIALILLALALALVLPARRKDVL